MNYVSATHQNTNCLQMKRPIIILTLTTFYLYPTKISFLRLDTASFLRKPKKLHKFHSSEDRNPQTQVNTGPSITNPIYTKLTAFASRKIFRIIHPVSIPSNKISNRQSQITILRPPFPSKIINMNTYASNRRNSKL